MVRNANSWPTCVQNSRDGHNTIECFHKNTKINRFIIIYKPYSKWYAGGQLVSKNKIEPISVFTELTEVATGIIFCSFCGFQFSGFRFPVSGSIWTHAKALPHLVLFILVKDGVHEVLSNLFLDVLDAANLEAGLGLLIEPIREEDVFRQNPDIKVSCIFLQRENANWSNDTILISEEVYKGKLLFKATK